MEKNNTSRTIDFWKTQNETGAIGRFLARLKNSVLIVDLEFADLFGALVDPSCVVLTLPAMPQGNPVDLGRLSALDFSYKNVIVLMLENGTKVQNFIQPRVAAAKGRLISYPYEVFISTINSDNEWQRRDMPATKPRMTYSIICTARSGSTYLSDLLARQNLGNPREHLRNPMLKLIENRSALGVDLATLLQQLGTRTQRDGIFATKIISGFYWPVADQISAEEQKIFHEFIWSKPKIYLYRSSKIDQAISDFVARTTRTWHVRSDAEAEDYKRRLMTVAYDFDLILQRYNHFIADESRLRAFLAPMQDVLTINYDDLINSPEVVVQRCGDFIQPGGVRKDPTPSSPLRRLTSDLSSQFRERFVTELRASKLFLHMKGDPLVAEIE